MCFCCVLQVIFFDETGQVADYFLAKIDIIISKVRNSYIYGRSIDYIFNGSYINPTNSWSSIFGIMSYHTMLQNGCSWTFYMNVWWWCISNNSINWKSKLKKIENELELVDEFLQLWSDYMYVDLYDNNIISKSTMIFFSKKVPAREASKTFVDRVIRQVNERYLIEKKTENVQKWRYSHQD